MQSEPCSTPFDAEVGKQLRFLAILGGNVLVSLVSLSVWDITLPSGIVYQSARASVVVHRRCNLLVLFSILFTADSGDSFRELIAWISPILVLQLLFSLLLNVSSGKLAHQMNLCI